MSGRTNEAAVATSKRATHRKSTSSLPHSSLGKEASREANRRAAAVLEVLGGFRTPSEAAAAVGISVHHYYLLERKALAGLLAGCEPQPKGPRGPSTEKKLAALERELETCRRECLRQAALVRATQRAVGLPAVPSPPKKSRKASGEAGSKKKSAGRRRPTVRALRAAEAVRRNASDDNSPDGLEKRLPQVQAIEGPLKNSSGENCAGELENRPEGATEETSPTTTEKERNGDAQG